VLLKLSRIDVLALDDFAMAPLKDYERRDFLEICDDGYQRRSMILLPRCRSRTGMNRSAISPWPRAFSIALSIVPIESNFMESRCGRNSVSPSGKAPNERRAAVPTPNNRRVGSPLGVKSMMHSVAFR
jgi:hypothetical protein